MLISLAALALIGIALVDIVNADGTRHVTLGWLLSVAMVGILASTVQYWRRWFFFLPGYVGTRCLAFLLLGWFSPKGFILVVFPPLMLAMAGLSYRFSKPKRIRSVDRVTLMIGMACFIGSLWAFFSPGPKVTALVFSGSGDLVLLLSKFGESRRKATRLRSTTGSGSPLPTSER